MVAKAAASPIDNRDEEKQSLIEREGGAKELAGRRQQRWRSRVRRGCYLAKHVKLECHGYFDHVVLRASRKLTESAAIFNRKTSGP
jgi:hypothetical protein